MTNLVDTRYGRKSAKFKDITGQKFGRLTAIKFLRTSKFERSVWLFECECGKETEAESKRIISGQYISCGCYRKEKTSLPCTEASFNRFYTSYIQGSARRGLEFNLTKEDFKIITSKNCKYCGREPYETEKKATNGIYLGNGIDRVDNREGYILSNCVPCCKYCNVLKLNMSLDTFLNTIKRIYEFSFK